MMMVSFHNDKKVKAKYINRVRRHAKADRLVQGTGWEAGKGCAIGCTLESYDHNLYPIELGIPVVLAKLEDRIFEGLTRVEATKWPARFLSAIRVGRDLSEVWPKYAIWLLRDVRKYARPDGKKAIDSVVGYFRLPAAQRTAEKLKGVRSAAASAAYAAAAAVASAVAANAAHYAAHYAANAAANASAVAANAAANASAAANAASAAANAAAAANASARSNHYKRQATTLLKLLRVA